MDEKLKNFYQLGAWKKSHKLALMIYQETKSFPKEEKYGLVDQLKRAASSVSANIAEGFGRYHFLDKIKFYYQARGSLNEVQSFTILAKDLDYLTEKKAKETWRFSKDCEKMINGLIRSAKKQFKKS